MQGITSSWLIFDHVSQRQKTRCPSTTARCRGYWWTCQKRNRLLVDQGRTKDVETSWGYTTYLTYLTSGNLTFCYGKIHPFLMGKSTISMGHFQ